MAGCHQRYVTVRVLAVSDNGTWTVRLSDHHNERTGEKLPDATVRIDTATFLRLAADHGLTAADFPVGKAVRVHEPALQERCGG